MSELSEHDMGPIKAARKGIASAHPDFTGPWAMTRSGRKIFYLRPERSIFAIEDIASGLANESRFNGQTREFYSVAQHSVILADLVQEKFGRRAAMQALLHDASEAYMKDLPSPLKALIPRYRDIERGLMDEIYHRYGLDVDVEPLSQVMKMDMALAADEARFWFDKDMTTEPDCMMEGTLGVKHFDRWTPSMAEWEFLKTFDELWEVK